MRRFGPRCLCLTAVSLLAALALASTASAHSDHKTVRILDDCDPATFNAAVGDGTCVGDGRTTFDAFAAEVGTTGAAKRWAFSRDVFDLDAGGSINVESRGGEFHTFTEVANFGGGCLQFLNDLSGNPIPVPECEGHLIPDVPPVFATTGVPPGGSLPVSGLAPGIHKFQCLIHPWMRSIAVVGDGEGHGGED
jgi:hypothetical protein